MQDVIRCPKCNSGNVIFSKKKIKNICEECNHEFQVETTFVVKRVFISYGHDEHVSLAFRLRDDLESRGHEVWFDENRLDPGHDWEEFIEKGLKHLSADKFNSAMVLLLTPYSVRRPDGYCLNEVACALTLGIQIIPLMVVESEPPLSICRIQWLDMRQCIPIHERETLYRPRFERLLMALEENQRDFEGTQQRLLKALQPLKFEADILKHLPKFTGRQWVFDAIHQWLAINPPKNRVFWISGSPGVGKTALSVMLSSRYLEIAALHLCMFGHAQKSDPRHVVMSIAYQLTTQLPEYETRLAAMDVESLARDDAHTMFDNLIVQPLAKLNNPNHPIVILIDALDEATRDGYNALAGFIASEFPKTPEWLRLIITSRPEKSVTAPLQGLSAFILDTDTEANRNDIHDYIRRELALLLQDHPDSDGIINHILTHSEGVFLYVEHVCNDLKLGNLSIDQLEKFPQGLGEVFLQFFNRLVWIEDKENPRPDYERYRQNYRPAIRAIIAARAPLPIGILQHIFNCKEDEIHDIIRPLSSLFPVTNEGGYDVIKPCHKLIIEWLTNYEKAGGYYISIEEGTKALTEACWTEFTNHPQKPMSDYCFTHLAVHLKEIGRWDELLLVVKSPNMGLIKRWVEQGEGDTGLDCLEGLCRYLTRIKRNLIDVAALATQIARIYSLRGNYKEAEYWLSQSLKFTSFFKGRRIRAIALHELGSLSLYNRNYKSSAKYYQKAFRLCTWGKTVHNDEAASNLIGLATIAKEKYQYKKALSLADRAIKLAIKSTDLINIIAGERIKGTAYKSLGEITHAENHLNTALKLCDLIDSSRERYRILIMLGYIHFDNSVFENKSTQTSFQLFEKAKIGAELSKDVFYSTEANLSLGWICVIDNKVSDSEYYYGLAMKNLISEAHPDLLARLNLGLGALKQKKGDMENAKKTYLEIIEFCQKKRIGSAQQIALIGLGSIFYHENNVSEANKLWKQAIRIAGKISKRKADLAKASIELCKNDPYEIPR